MANILYDNCFITSYQTFVKEVVEENGRYWHYLDETIFYCGSGGMDDDEGLINLHRVLKLKKEYDKVWHLLDVKLEGNVTLSVDFHRRFASAQIHTAQHLISGIMESVYGYHTTSHHVQGAYNDIEFDCEEIKERQLHELQVIINGLIRDDLRVKIFYPTKIEMPNYDIKNPGLYDEVRMVGIGDITTTPCGCIHVPSLRYLQMIKINGVHKGKKGVRIHYVCGDQMLANYDRYYEILSKASHLLAQPFDFVEVGILKLMQENRNQKADLVYLREKYVDALCANLDVHQKQYKVYEDMDLRTFMLLVDHYSKLSESGFIFLWKQENRMHIALFSKAGKAKTLWERVAQHVNVNGGGSEYLIQGGASYQSEVEDVLHKMVEEL